MSNSVDVFTYKPLIAESDKDELLRQLNERREKYKNLLIKEGNPHILDSPIAEIYSEIEFVIDIIKKLNAGKFHCNSIAQLLYDSWHFEDAILLLMGFWPSVDKNARYHYVRMDQLSSTEIQICSDVMEEIIPNDASVVMQIK